MQKKKERSNSWVYRILKANFSPSFFVFVLGRVRTSFFILSVSMPRRFLFTSHTYDKGPRNDNKPIQLELTVQKHIHFGSMGKS